MCVIPLDKYPPVNWVLLENDLFSKCPLQPQAFSTFSSMKWHFIKMPFVYTVTKRMVIVVPLHLQIKNFPNFTHCFTLLIFTQKKLLFIILKIKELYAFFMFCLLAGSPYNVLQLCIKSKTHPDENLDVTVLFFQVH